MTTKAFCRFLLFVSFVVFVILVNRPWAVVQQTPSAWTQFRGDARLSGIAAQPPADTLTLRWTYDAPEGIESSAAIADGVVYVGASNGDLLAIDLESGKLRWKYSTGSEIGESSPAVGGGLVYVGDLAGVVHAVHVRDGSRAWTFKTAAK
jgi:outer membrane protein assembly factor BamB